MPAEHGDQDVPRWPVRPHAALRHPRARHGLDHERHRRCTAAPASYGGTFLIVQRLHARRGPARRADEAAGHLRLDARLDRPRRGRPDPPADRALRRAAGHPRPGRRPPGRRQRDRRRPGAPSWSTPTARPALALSRQNLPTFDRDGARSAEGAAKGGYVLAEASSGHAAGDPDRHRLRGADRRRRPGACWRPRASRPGSSRCRAGSGSPSRTRPTSSEVLPPAVRARVSVEAGVPMGWRRLRRRRRRIVGLEHYGASAAYTMLYEQFGFTARPSCRGARACRPPRPVAAPNGATSPSAD